MARSDARRVRVKRKKGYKTKRTHALSMVVVTGVVMMMLLIVGIGAAGLQEKKELLQAESQAIESQIAKEEERALEIEEYGKEVQTKKFYEEYARDKLKLIYPNETIFKKQD